MSVKSTSECEAAPVIILTMTSKEEEYLVYLGSLGSKDQFPENLPGSFVNNIIPLPFTPNREYEVALHGIFIPREIYTLHQDDGEAILEVYAETNIRGDGGSGGGGGGGGGDGGGGGTASAAVNVATAAVVDDAITKIIDSATSATYDSLNAANIIPSKEIHGTERGRRQLRCSLKPPRNIASKEVRVIVEELNIYWFDILKAVFGFSNYKTYFNERRGILSYTKKKNYVCYHTRAVDGCNGLNYCKISLLFKPRLAAILGFIPNQLYDIFVTDEGREYGLQEVSAHFPPDPHANVDYLHLYSDIIQPTRFAGQTVNILATLSYGGSNNYHSVQRPLYKKLSKNTIDSIAVLVTDQYGRKVYFEERRSATIILHIRPTPTIY